LIIRKTFTLLCFWLLVGCTTPLNRADRAENALLNFFNLLNRGDYQSASTYFGGEYGPLTDMNPGINPSDHADLWANACHNNGFICLPVSKAIFLGSTENNIFSFEVEFLQADGSQFSRGACCGEDPASVIPQTLFIYRVLETDEGEYLVLDLPVYIP
jgi:hypothetical protein